MIDDEFVLSTRIIEILDDNRRKFNLDFTNRTWALAKMVEGHSVVAVTSTEPDDIHKKCVICYEKPPTFFQCAKCEGALCIPCFIQAMSDNLESQDDGSMQFNNCPACRNIFQNLGPRYEHR